MVPRWLWRMVAGGFVLALLAIVGLALALTQGVADSPRAGPLRWSDDFKAGLARWDLVTRGGQLAAGEGALVAELNGPEQWVAALTEGPPGDFTLEIAGTQTAGEPGARYGLVFGWQDETHYSVVLINANGYAEAYQQDGAERRGWFAWQQWPNILVGTASNRVRLDVRGEQVIAHINDEWLFETRVDPAGKLGVLATGSPAASRVVFSWARVWAR